MNSRKTLCAVLLAAALCISYQARALTSGSDSFQGVTFQWVASGTHLELTLTGLSSASGNWAGIEYLAAFEIGIDGLAGATSTGWTTYSNQMAASGCAGGTSTNHHCFERAAGDPLALTSDTLTLGIDLQGLSSDPNAVHLKVAFLDQSAYDTYFCPTCAGYNTPKPGWKKTGSLLSMTIPVPEPEVYAMMAVGLGAIGWVTRRRKRTEHRT